MTLINHVYICRSESISMVLVHPRERTACFLNIIFNRFCMCSHTTYHAYQHAALTHIHQTGSYLTARVVFIHDTTGNYSVFFFSFFQGQKPGLTDVQAELDRMTRKSDSMVTTNTPATENEAWARLHLGINQYTNIKEQNSYSWPKFSPSLCVNQKTEHGKCWDSVWMYRPWCFGGKKGGYLKRCDCFFVCLFIFVFPDLFVCFCGEYFWWGMASQWMGALS